MNNKLIYVEEKSNGNIYFNFYFNSVKYWGWVDPNTEEFKLNSEDDKNINVLGWCYAVPRYQDESNCDCCNENTCYNCPYSKVEQAGWEYTDLINLLTKTGFINDILGEDKSLEYEKIIDDELSNDLHLLISKIKYKQDPKEIATVVKSFNWDWYDRNKIIAVLNHFANLGNHGNWRNYDTLELSDPALQAGKTNTELMIMLAKAVSSVSKKVELGFTNSAWGDFTF